MKKEKDFDCLEMKDQLQARLIEEYKGLDDDEIWAEIHRKSETSDNSVWVWLRRIQKPTVA